MKQAPIQFPESCPLMVPALALADEIGSSLYDGLFATLTIQLAVRSSFRMQSFSRGSNLAVMPNAHVFLTVRCISFAPKGPDKTAPGNARGGGCETFDGAL